VARLHLLFWAPRRRFAAARRRALGVALLLASACSSDTNIRLLEPSGHGGSDAGHAPPADAGSVDAGAGGMVLRYDFGGTGMTVLDRIGHENGQLVGGAMLDGQGGVVLDGEDDYVDIPNGVVSRLGNATFIAWLQWDGGVCWQRVFDFGSTDQGENTSANGLTALYLTCAACPNNNLMANLEIGDKHTIVAASAGLPEGRNVQVALVIDRAQASSTLYVDGEQVASTARALDLHVLDDENNWLGRSQWVQDRYLKGRYDEFRIYAEALSEAEIAAAFTRGPDQP
jgi:hypothetical protein